MDSKQLILGLRSLQTLDERHHRRKAILFATGRIHCQLIQVAQFLLDSTILIAVFQQFLQDAVDTLVVVFSQTVETTVA